MNDLQPRRDLAAQPATILFVHDGQDWIRGSERCLLDLVGSIDRRRFRPMVLCDAPELQRAVEALGVPAHRSRGWREAGDRLLPSRRTVGELGALMDEHHVRLVHCNTAMPVKAALAAARRRRVPVVAHLHIVHPRHTRLYAGLHQVSVAVGVSDAAVDGLRRDGMAAHRTRVIYNGVDELRLGAGDHRALRGRLGIRPDDVVLTALGSLIRRKGVDVVLEALALLPGDLPRCHLLLAGEGNQRGHLEQRARDLGVADRVHFLGEVGEPGAVLRDATDLVVSAARQEAFPLNLIEAAYCGRAIVASDIPPHRESIVPGVTGVLFPTDDARGLATAIDGLLRDPARRVAMGRRGQQRAREQFLLRHYVARFEELYRELLDAPPRAHGWLRGAHWPRTYWRWLGETLARRLSPRQAIRVTRER